MSDATNYPGASPDPGAWHEYEIEVTATHAYFRNITLNTEISGAHAGWVGTKAYICVGVRNCSATFRDFRMVR